MGFRQYAVGIQPNPCESSVQRRLFQPQQDPITDALSACILRDPHPFDLGKPAIAKSHTTAPDSFAIHPRDKELTCRRRIGSISGSPTTRPVKSGRKAAIYFTEISIQTDDSIRV